MGFDRIPGLPAKGKVAFDLLDSESNSRAQGYCSLFPEPGANPLTLCRFQTGENPREARSHLSR